MKYTIRVGSLAREIDVEEGSDGTLVMTYAGNPVTVSLKRAGDTPLYSVLIDGESFEVFVEPIDGGFAVGVDTELYEAGVRQGGRRAGDTAVAAGASGELTITAPMTGVVAAVNVRPGDAVTHNQVLVVIEAMKMNNEIRAPRDGTVKQVLVTQGARVDQRAPVAVLA